MTLNTNKMLHDNEPLDSPVWMEGKAARKRRMAPFRKSSFWVDLAVITVAVACAVGFALMLSDLIWGPEIVTNWIAGFIV